MEYYLSTLGNHDMPFFEHLQYFTEIKSLNNGGFSEVKLYQCRDVHYGNVVCNKTYVAKKMKMSYHSQSFIDRMMYNEYFHCSILKHENIIKALHVDQVSRCLIFEHFESIDMFDYLEIHPVIDPDTLLLWFSQLTDAVSYIHGNFVAHMDIKLENIIIDLEHQIIKLIDFGHAMHFDVNKKHDKIWGTECYMSPEMLSYRGYFPDKVDVWCCGIVLYNMMYNKMPWADSRSDRCKHACLSIEHDILDPTIFQPHKLLNQLRQLFIGVLQPMPKERIDIHQAKNLLIG